MHTKLKVTVVTAIITLMLTAVAHAMSGTYVVLTKGGGGLALFFTEKGTFTSIALNNSHNKRKHYGKGKYTVAGNQLTITTSDGVKGTMMIERNGDLYDKATNLRLHRYNRRR
jgi:hypothetical protein